MKVALMIIVMMATVVSVINAANSKEDSDINLFRPSGSHRSLFNMFQPAQPSWGLQRFGMTGSRMTPSYHRYRVPGHGSSGMRMANPFTSRGAMWNNFLNQRSGWGGQRRVNPYDIASPNTGYVW